MAKTLELLKASLQKPVALVGMMGSGKTSLGRALADALSLPFFDSDAEIEQQAGLSVSSIFETLGEGVFRDLEERIIENVAHQGLCVLATGGGALLRPRTQEMLHARCITAWLDVSHDILWSRLEACRSRPLLSGDNPQQRLEDLARQRQPLYNQSHIHLEIREENPQQSLERLIKALSEAVNSDSF
jgi:shikimate kinase